MVSICISIEITVALCTTLSLKQEKFIKNYFISCKLSSLMNKSHVTSSMLNYSLSILAVTATILLGCNKTHMAAVQEEDHSFATQDKDPDRITILESVPSQEENLEVPAEILMAGTAGRSGTGAYLDSISITEIASIERRVGLDHIGSVSTDAERRNSRVVVPERKKEAAIKIQSVARMYNSNKQLSAERNIKALEDAQKDLSHSNRGKQSYLIKLGAVGASAFALGGYVDDILLHQRKAREAQKAREEADMRIRQLERLISTEKTKDILQKSADFYSPTATFNSDTGDHSPHFFDAYRLYSMRPVLASVGVGIFLVGGYVARKINRSFQERNKEISRLEKKLATTRKEKQEVEGQLTASSEKAGQLEIRLGESIVERQVKQDRIVELIMQKDRLQEALKAETDRLSEIKANTGQSEEKLKISRINKEVLQTQTEKLQSDNEELRSNVGNLQERVEKLVIDNEELDDQLDRNSGDIGALKSKLGTMQILMPFDISRSVDSIKQSMEEALMVDNATRSDLIRLVRNFKLVQNFDSRTLNETR